MSLLDRFRPKKEPPPLDKHNRNERALFDPKYVYPTDRRGGRFCDLSGVIVSRSLEWPDCASIEVETARGTFTGFLGEPMVEVARRAKYARIRCYDWGGGWYPDNRIQSLSTRKP